MQTWQRYALTAVFTLTCLTVPVTSVGAAENGEAEVTSASEGLPPASGTTPVIDSSESAVGRESVTGPVLQPKVATQTPAGVGPVPGKAIQAVKTRLEESFRKERREFQLSIEAARGSKVIDRKRQERDRNRDRRSSMNSAVMNRMLELQRTLLEISFEDLRSRRSDRRELIDAAKDALKERAKEAYRERRGHGN